MKTQAYTVGYTIAVTVFFVGLVSAFNVAVADRIERNQLVAQRRVILRLLEAGPGPEADDEAVMQAFDERVRPVRYPQPEAPRPYTVYRLRGATQPVAVLPLYGQGFWAPIGGYLALNRETGEVRGIAFTEQNETPGLGARIQDEEFRKPFRQMRLSLREKAAGRRVTMTPPNSVPNGPTEFDAITGATGTSRAVETILNRSLERFLSLTAQEPLPEGTDPAEQVPGPGLPAEGRQRH